MTKSAALCHPLECFGGRHATLARRFVESDRGADKGFECTYINFLSLADVDRASYVPVKAGIEELGWILHVAPLANVNLTLSL